MKNTRGFTLIEVLIYTSVLVIASGLMVGIMTVMLRIQSREIGGAGVTQELTFVTNTIKRLVREASFVGVGSEGQTLKYILEAAAGVSGTRLVLLPGAYDDEATEIYYNEEEKKIYLKNAGESPSSLTTSKVSVDDFSVTKYENEGSHSIVLLDVTMTSGEGTQNPITRSFQTAIARISAATFDSNLIPGGASYDLGSGSTKWKNAWFSGAVTIDGDLSVDGGTFSVDSVNNKVEFGSDLKIGSGGFLQLDVVSGSPSSSDCDSASEAGRMVWSTNKHLYICGNNQKWWKSQDYIEQ